MASEHGLRAKAAFGRLLYSGPNRPAVHISNQHYLAAACGVPAYVAAAHRIVSIQETITDLAARIG
jgi:hypothetical protein